MKIIRQFRCWTKLVSSVADRWDCTQANTPSIRMQNKNTSAIFSGQLQDNL